MSTDESFIEELLQRVPELIPAYDDHIRDNDSLLPHVFMGDVTRFVIAETGNSRNRPAISKLLDCLEEYLRTDQEKVHELIVASFVENLSGEEPTIRSLKPYMGPVLTAEIENHCK